MFNNKPINVEAQRVQKVIQDTTRRLGVLALLNEEFFTELRKKDDQEIINWFGPQVAKLMIKHAQLEDEFNTECLENQVKIKQLDDEETTEEQRKVILDLGVTTNKIVRVFSTDQEMYQKLNVWKQNSSEFSGYMESIEQLDELMMIKLCTPKEEVDLVKKNQKVLQEKVSKLKEQYDSKKDAYDKYVEECSKSKELRDVNVKTLKEQINNVHSINEQRSKEALEAGEGAETEIKRVHDDVMVKLMKEQNQFQAKMTEVEKMNGGQEREMNKDYWKVYQDFHNNMNQYDQELFGTTAENSKINGEYEDTANDLREIEAQYKDRIEARMKREEIAAIMQKKKDEENAKFEKVGRSCEWIQAHWRGMLARKEMEKARKGKKKKKKKK